MSKLNSAIVSAGAKAAAAASRLQTAWSGRRPMRDVQIPGTELRAVMLVMGAERRLDILGEVGREMERRGIEQNVLNQAKFELEEARRVLAEVVVGSAQDLTPIGSLADWGQLTPEVIGALWIEYAELCAAHDPSVETLTEPELVAIRAAIAKKNAPALLYCGVRRLTAYLLTSVAPPASSSIGMSSPGDSSLDT